MIFLSICIFKFPTLAIMTSEFIAIISCMSVLRRNEDDWGTECDVTLRILIILAHCLRKVRDGQFSKKVYSCISCFSTNVSGWDTKDTERGEDLKCCLFHLISLFLSLSLSLSLSLYNISHIYLYIFLSSFFCLFVCFFLSFFL